MMLDGLNHDRPVGRVDSLLPTQVSPVEAAGRESVQGLLFRRPRVDVLLGVPVESHRAGGLLRQLQQFLFGLQPLGRTLAFGDVSPEGEIIFPPVVVQVVERQLDRIGAAVFPSKYGLQR